MDLTLSVSQSELALLAVVGLSLLLLIFDYRFAVWIVPNVVPQKPGPSGTANR